jgi:chloramphenicol 3-O-phosphotransferase
MLVLFGGPAGAGKSTLAAAWCATRTRAVHIELDAVRELIVSGRADPQQPGDLAGEQYGLSVAACCALAGPFLAAGYDVAIDDVFEPAAFEAYWRPRLGDRAFALVIVRPSLEATLARSARRQKRVLEQHTRSQHEATGGWDARFVVDTTGLSVEESLERVEAVIGGSYPGSLRSPPLPARDGFLTI